MVSVELMKSEPGSGSGSPWPSVMLHMGETESPSTGTLNDAYRRLDWLFLLPSVKFATVAQVGMAPATLLYALHLLCPNVAKSDLGAPSGVVCGHYDLVVACNPSLDQLSRAIGLIKPAGWLYVETDKRARHVGRRDRGDAPGDGSASLRCPADYRIAMGRLGCGDIRAYWHWPSFESCAEIVPLGERGVVLHALGRRGHSAAAKVKGLLARGLVHVGWFDHVVTCFSVVAQKMFDQTPPGECGWVSPPDEIC